MSLVCTGWVRSTFYLFCIVHLTLSSAKLSICCCNFNMGRKYSFSYLVALSRELNPGSLGEKQKTLHCSKRPSFCFFIGTWGYYKDKYKATKRRQGYKINNSKKNLAVVKIVKFFNIFPRKVKQLFLMPILKQGSRRRIGFSISLPSLI